MSHLLHCPHSLSLSRSISLHKTSPRARILPHHPVHCLPLHPPHSRALVWEVLLVELNPLTAIAQKTQLQLHTTRDHQAEYLPRTLLINQEPGTYGHKNTLYMKAKIFLKQVFWTETHRNSTRMHAHTLLFKHLG